MSLGDEVALRVGDRCERIGARDERPDFTALDVADQILEDAGLRNGAAEQPQVLEVQGAQVELDNGPGNSSRDRVATAAPQDLEESRELAATHDVDNDIH